MRIAVTGGIGSGKSFVCRMLEARGISIYYCDVEAQRIMASRTDVQAELKELVGPDVYLPASTPSPFGSGLCINKPRLSAFMHQGAEAAAQVNAIVHPRVAADFMASGKEWMECAILFESGFDRYADFIVSIACPLPERIRRITERDHCDRATALRWIGMQTSEEERCRRAHHVILNDGLQPLLPQIERLLEAVAERRGADAGGDWEAAESTH